ncbi:isochorismatase family protein [Alkalicoccobacillus murimartini]|uniref:Nicotinamidase-related amidase n=1 Tax=Alkalicoccobacillus murimartini TaxID=171685 RepID=A0ABT9YCY4_9BACI|nr:isochorismatase family protein [Alkalicoccobacillus murimartini]MDQ0205682.1 nicotinamidase-related amidase [Alkalicoccobacillus murimartini]
MKQALVIIDAQQELIDGNHEESQVFKKKRLLMNINLVIQQAIDAADLIVFVRDKEVANGEGAGFHVHKDIQLPNKNAVFIDKEATNSFYNTNLLSTLKEHTIDHLVIMGCKTEHCIDTAVRTATVHGFDVTLVGDGHSTQDSAVLTAEQIIAHHNATLHGHYNVDHFSVVRQTNDSLFNPIHHQYR